MVEILVVALFLADEQPPRQFIAQGEPMGAPVPRPRRRREKAPTEHRRGPWTHRTAEDPRSNPSQAKEPEKSAPPEKAAAEEPQAPAQAPPLSEAAKLGGGIDNDLWNDIVSLAKQNQPAAEIRSQLGQRLKGVTFTVQQQVYLRNTYGIDYNQLLP